MIDMANQRGGHDNVTLVLMQMPPAGTQRAVADLNKRRRRLGCLAILLLVFVLLVYVYLRNGAAFRISSSCTRSVKPSLHSNMVSPGNSLAPWLLSASASLSPSNSHILKSGL